MFQEFNFDGIVGPTHNYAGLAQGNLASSTHRAMTSHPRRAALQGLAKMRALWKMGVPQAVLPPLERPSIPALRTLGFTGADEAAILARAAREAPHLLAAATSASSMWTANAATVAPSCDTADGRLHVSPANLESHLHRALEAPETTGVLRRIFADPEHFVVHDPLPGGSALRDEGAANHTRLTPAFDRAGIHLFVYGKAEGETGNPGPSRFPARQTRAASASIARRHQLPSTRVLLWQQNPAAIDAGVFHNDVIAVGHRNILFHHEEAFLHGPAGMIELENLYAQLYADPLSRVEVPAARVDLDRAVRTYLFNSQIVTLPDDSALLVCPGECEEDSVVAALLEEVVADLGNPITAVRFFDLRESMRNGGGPACLRQRIVMNTSERAAVQARVFLDDQLADELETWICKHYREALTIADLADPSLLEESRTALDELTGLLGLGSVYSFQKGTEE